MRSSFRKLFLQKNERNGYYQLAKFCGIKGDNFFVAKEWAKAEREYREAVKLLIEGGDEKTHEDYRMLASYCLQIGRSLFYQEYHRLGKGRENKILFWFDKAMRYLNVIRTSWIDYDYSLLAACHDWIGKCYKTYHPNVTKHAYLSFSALKKMLTLEHSENDCRRLIYQFSECLEERLELEPEELFKDCCFAIKAMNGIKAPTGKDHAAFASLYQYMGRYYLANKNDKNESFNYFSLVFDHLQLSDMTTLRTWERCFNRIKRLFEQGSLENRLFSCAAMIFSSSLTISEESRLKFYHHVLVPELDILIESACNKICYKNFLHILKLLRDTCLSDLFPPGSFKTMLKDEVNFLSLSCRIDKLEEKLSSTTADQNGVTLRSLSFFDAMVVERSNDACLSTNTVSSPLSVIRSL